MEIKVIIIILKFIYNLICFLGSLASLVALPIALFQIIDVKKKLHDSEQKTDRIFKRGSKEKLELILSSLIEEHNKLVSIKIAYKKQGTKWNSIRNDISSIIQILNENMHQLPVDCKVEEKLLRESIERLGYFISNDSKNREEEIYEAETIFNNCIDSIKKKIEEEKKEELALLIKAK